MKIAVTHLTRMQRGYVCVAGVDVETDQHVRPIDGTGRLKTDVLARHGGPFDLATIVDLGATQPAPVKPELEDHEFSPHRARAVDTIDAERYWRLLTRLARPKLATIFGPDLEQRAGGGATVDVDAGRASLGCLIPSRPPELYVRPRDGRPGQVRIKLTDGHFDLDAGVTDIRLYGKDHVTPDDGVVQRMSERIAAGAGVLLSVGLTRPFSAALHLPPVHWLQVNNIHLEDDPTWRLGSQSGFRRLIRLIFDF